jgi:hypothetical protein
MGYGYAPGLSEGSLKPPIFLTSTFVFENAQQAAMEMDRVSITRANSGPTPSEISAITCTNALLSAGDCTYCCHRSLPSVRTVCFSPVRTASTRLPKGYQVPCDANITLRPHRRTGPVSLQHAQQRRGLKAHFGVNRDEAERNARPQQAEHPVRVG